MNASKALRVIGAAGAVSMLSLWYLGMARGESATPPVPARTGVVTFVQGDAFHRESQKPWEPLELDENVRTGEAVETRPRSRAELRLDAGKLIRIDENSLVHVAKLFDASQRKQEVELKIERGQLWSQVASLGGQEEFRIRSPLASAAVRGTVFNVAVAENQATRVDVFSGVVDIYNPLAATPYRPGQRIEAPREVPGPREVTVQEWYYIVRQLQRAYIEPDHQQIRVEDISEDEAATEWQRWNEARDRGENVEGFEDQPSGGEVPVETPNTDGRNSEERGDSPQ